MAAITLYRNSDGSDIANTYVTKEYVMDWYPDLVPNMLTPELFVCGRNDQGQLGTNNISNYSSPVTTAAGGTNWKQTAVGGKYSAAIKTDGTLWTWGRNSAGQLGNNNTSSYSSPVTVAGGGTNWKQVACGYDHSAAIKTDGTLWTWGSTSFGKLGDAGFLPRSSPGTTAGGGTNWKQVACGYHHTAAIKTDGTLWACGYNLYGQLGDGTTTDRSSPVTVAGGGTNWKQVAGGSKRHTAAVKTDGTLWTWGIETFGRLGDGTLTAKSSPGTTAGGGTNWKQVACGYAHTAALKTDGTLWAWGYNAFGQLGDGTISDTSSPGTTAGGGTNWKQIPGAWYSTTGVKTDGTLWTWGYNFLGDLGNGTQFNRSSPGTTAGGGTNWKQVSSGYFRVLAISEAEGW